ncbi:hypothetical protein GY45DRAFT_433255 [Cubamyces sp. BRFM 1775]|nr:hypothetical protein GY45DRAFT_433255 [Cubamyces sp. BRFM 1775]
MIQSVPCLRRRHARTYRGNSQPCIRRAPSVKSYRRLRYRSRLRKLEPLKLSSGCPASRLWAPLQPLGMEHRGASAGVLGSPSSPPFHRRQHRRGGRVIPEGTI